MKGLYEALGVAPTATSAEIKRAYSDLVLQHHPDKPGGSESAFHAVQQAYEVLRVKTMFLCLSPFVCLNPLTGHQIQE